MKPQGWRPAPQYERHRRPGLACAVHGVHGVLDRGIKRLFVPLFDLVRTRCSWRHVRPARRKQRCAGTAG